AMDPLGRFLYANSNDDTVVGVALDPVAGEPTPIPGSPFSLGGERNSVPAAVAVDPTGQYLYAVDLNSSVYGFRIQADGTLVRFGVVAVLPSFAESMVAVSSK